MVTISVDYDVTLHIFAEKENYIRSDKVTVTVGEGTIQPPSSEEVHLTADILPAISINVSPGSVDFGDNLAPGDTSNEHEITISNAGAWEVKVTTELTEESNDLFVRGLRLNGKLWGSFLAIIGKNESIVTLASLHVPEAYTEAGEKTGTLIFWAEGA
jgi:hypothetical protein